MWLLCRDNKYGTFALQNAQKSFTYIAGDINKKVVCKSPGSFPEIQFSWKMKGDDFTFELPSSNFTNINITNERDR